MNIDLKRIIDLFNSSVFTHNGKVLNLELYNLVEAISKIDFLIIFITI